MRNDVTLADRSPKFPRNLLEASRGDERATRSSSSRLRHYRRAFARPLVNEQSAIPIREKESERSRPYDF